MKKKISIILMMLLLGVCSVQADTVWTSGHHEIVNNDVYGEIYMYNGSTLDIWGGEIYRLAAYDTTISNWYDGTMDTLWALEESIVNIYGGQLGDIGADEKSIINLYAYDMVLDNTTYILSGRYYSNDNFFTIDVHNADVYSHINIVPEPATLLLFGLGGLFLRKGRRCERKCLKF